MILKTILIFSSAMALQFNSVIHEKDSGFKKPLFKAEVRTKSEGDIKITEAVTRAASGDEVALREVTRTRNGDLLEYKIEQLQTKEKARIEIRDGQVFFEKTGADGKSKSSTEKIKNLPVIVTSNLLMFVQKNWDRLEKEKELEFRLAVWDRQETVGFEMIREKVESTPYGQALKVKMKPSSFVIAALVKPIEFWFSLDGTKLLMMKGRVGPKQKVGSDWEPLDGEVQYDWL